jgi:hypothetical protein
MAIQCFFRNPFVLFAIDSLIPHVQVKHAIFYALRYTKHLILK